MLWRTSRLADLRLEATDGAIGGIWDCLFDDTSWTVRWFVVDTGTWLSGRRVLLAPDQVSIEGGVLTLGITKRQVRDSPELDSDAPVSRQYERSVVEHYGWTAYWLGMPYAPAEPGPATKREELDEGARGDPHLRSTSEMGGYHLRAQDGEIGHIEDSLLDPTGWVLRYLIVDTRNWWPGKHVLILPQAVSAINWADSTVDVALTRNQIRAAPEYDPAAEIDRAFEERYFRHYDHRPYWSD